MPAAKKTPSARSLAPPLQLRPVSLGSQLVFVLQLRVSFLSTLPKKKDTLKACLSFWASRAEGPLHPLVIQMLGGNEFRLRQGFRLRRKRLYAAKAAPARRPVGQSSIYWGNFKISILTVPSKRAPDEPLRFVWRFFFHCPSPPSGHEAFLVPEYKLSGVEFDAIIQLARAHLAESEAG